MMSKIVVCRFFRFSKEKKITFLQEKVSIKLQKLGRFMNFLKRIPDSSERRTTLLPFHLPGEALR
jgi:hypothetical protein